MTHRWFERPAFAGRILLVAAAAWAVGSGAHAQRPLVGESIVPQGEFLGEAPSTGLLLDADSAPGRPSYDPMIAAPYGDDSQFESNDFNQTRPVNWISGPYLRSGVNFVLGDDLFDVDQKTGYGISGGFRQPLGPEIGGDRFFFDLGGSYQDAYGEATPVNFGGRQITSIGGVVVGDIIVPNAFAATLEEARRGSLHAALGWYWGAPLDSRRADPQLRFATRIGGRVGHLRGGYQEALIIAPPAANQTIDPVFYQKTDTYGGLYAGTEAILLKRDLTFGHFQWTVDAEFANDWVNIGNIWEGNLGTASVMLGFMLSR